MTAATIERIVNQIIRSDMIVVSKCAKEILEEKQLKRCRYCTMLTNSDECPLIVPPTYSCGWELNEEHRRSQLPLVYDRKTKTRRKFIGKKSQPKEAK